MSKTRLQKWMFEDIQHILSEYGTDTLKLYKFVETTPDFYNESLEKTYETGVRFFGYPVIMPKNEKTSDAGREKDVFLTIYIATSEIERQGWDQVPITDKDVVEFDGVRYDVLDLKPIGYVVDQFLLYKMECRNG